MAITLPKASPAIGGTGGRRKGARLADAGDVPQVRAAGDPGLNVPNFAQFEGRLGDVGAAVSDVSSTFQRIEQRREGLSRDADDTTYTEKLSDLIRDAEKTGDFADPNVIDQLGEEAVRLQEEILSNHKGGSQSQAMLQNRLDRRRVGFADSLAVKDIQATTAKQSGNFDKRNRAITADIFADPEVLLAPDLGAVFRKHEESLEDEIDFINPSPAVRRGFEEIGRENIVQSMITPLIQQGLFSRAEALLIDPEIKEVLDPGTRRVMAERIGAARRELGKARAEGESHLIMAETILGPGASDEDIRAGAAQLAGMADSQNLTFLKSGDDIIGMDQSSGAIAVRIPGPSAEQQADVAGQIETAKLSSRMAFLNNVLGGVGADPLPGPEETEGGAPGQTDGPAISAPFGPEETASQDAQSVARLFSTSRRLALVGETGLANHFMGEARFLAQNSPEMQRARELDKPIGAGLASELGVELGTPLREVMEQIPPTPGELAKERAVGGAQGRQQVENQEQLGFIDEARIMVGDLLDEIETDPGIVGIRGSLRATGQTAISVLGDLGFDALADTARELAFDNTELGLNSITDMFESPTLSALDIMENSIGLILARLRTPQGRIPVDVIKRSIDDVQLKGLKGSVQIQNRLNFVLDQLNRRSKAIRGRSGEQPESPDLPQFRIEGGKLVPVEQ